jgi:hypothetical protein
LEHNFERVDSGKQQIKKKRLNNVAEEEAPVVEEVEIVDSSSPSPSPNRGAAHVDFSSECKEEYAEEEDAQLQVRRQRADEVLRIARAIESESGKHWKVVVISIFYRGLL